MTKKLHIEQYLSTELLASYRKKEISFIELAHACNVGECSLTKYFRLLGLKTNRDLKHESIYHKVFSSLDNEFSVYLLGLFAADGSIYTMSHKGGVSTSKIFSLGCTELDSQNLKRLHDVLCPNHYFSKTPSKVNQDGSISKPIVSFSFASSQIYEDLKNLGFGERKTYCNLHLPKLEDRLLWHFIRGYFDGDGSVGYYKGKTYKDKQYYNSSFSIISKTNTLLIDIKDFFSKYGIYSCIHEDKKKNVWYISVNKRSSIKLIQKMMYDNSEWYLERKYLKFMEIPS